MRPWGTPRPWPPEADQELARLLSRRRSDAVRGVLPAIGPTLTDALNECDAWLADPRDYDRRQHQRAWTSMARDMREILEGRGPHLLARIPALASLQTELGHPSLGADWGARERCRTFTTQGRHELALPDAAVAAFDDLVDAVRAPETPYDLVEVRRSIFEAALESADRSFAAEAGLLAGVLDDAALEVRVAQHELEGATMGPPPDAAASAGLPFEARLDLCRRLLRRTGTPGHHVVWLAYDRARIRVTWMLEMGPVTFFDWSAVVGALESLAEPHAASHLQEVLPPELLGESDGVLADMWLRQSETTDMREWVVVRVDLGTGLYADPLGIAQRQLDAVVQLAGFHGGGTSWRRIEGYCHLIDGVTRQWSPRGSADDRDSWNDHTGEVLDDLVPDLANHLPVTDGRLLELLDAAGVVEAHSRDYADPTTLLNDVRVIELLAARCDTGWAAHLKTTFADGWARDRALNEVYGAVAGLNGHLELREFPGMPDAGQLLERVPGQPGRVRVRYDVALAAASALAGALPAHAPGARRLRQLAARTSSPERLRSWIDSMVAEYGCRVDRLARCRNSLAHGGPVNLRVAATVKQFANRQAARTTSTGLWAALRGEAIDQAHADLRARDGAWKDRIGAAASVAVALDLEAG